LFGELNQAVFQNAIASEKRSFNFIENQSNMLVQEFILISLFAQYFINQLKFNDHSSPFTDLNLTSFSFLTDQVFFSNTIKKFWFNFFLKYGVFDINSSIISRNFSSNDSFFS
jgi:hypothetical protein